MDLSEEVWKVINETPKVNDEIKQSLHINIMRLIERSKSSPVGGKHGVTFATQESSLSGDRVAQNRRHKPSPDDTKPKSV